ncbi:MAG: RAMP superfamily CRISPR-associated protein [Desulfococcaceae bacterium]
MLKRMINHAVVEFTITPVDPLLIKSGQATVGGVDMAFVRTYRRGNEEPEPFIPGSSLKGVVRSYAEMICRSLRVNPVPVCLPYVAPGREAHGEGNQASCGLRIEGYKRAQQIPTVPTSDIYKISCPACRTFGSHAFIGRFATSDAYLTDAFRQTGKAVLEVRDGVAIDRLTGGPAGGAKYDLEVLTRGEFGAGIEIRNFERWQLGLLGLVLRDMADELVRIGLGKSRGLGRIRAEVTKFSVTSYARKLEGLTGLAGVCTTEETEAYGFAPEPGGEMVLPEPEVAGLRYTYDLTETWRDALEPAVKDLTAYIESVSWPGDIRQYTGEG